MPDEYYSDNQPRLIHCDNCGEDYAATYRACPFCHTGPDGKKVTSRSSGSRSSREGNRVRTNTRGGGYGGPRSPLSIVGIVLAVVLIVAAVIIVIVLAKSLFSGADKDGQQPASNPSSSITSQEDEGNEPAQPVPPDGVSLDQAELTLTPGTTGTLVASIDPVNWIGQVFWSTSDAGVATVDQSGVVTYVNEGTCTISVSAAGVTASCTVTCAGAGEPAAPSEPQQPTQSSIVVTAYGNTMDGDFTLKISEGAITFKATGGDGANYNWSMADPSIATVDPTTGKVTPLAEGKTTMTVTSGGESTQVIIRVKN